MENAGFMFEQLVLWLSANNIGSVWLGGTKDEQPDPEGHDLITIAFGEPTVPIHRSESEFVRKPISKMTNAPDDECIQAVRFAPSGMNIQPWYFEKIHKTILVYKRKLKFPYSIVYKKADIDMGIALCHYYLACGHFGKDFSFKRVSRELFKKGDKLYGEID
jgi:nitroreductase